MDEGVSTYHEVALCELELVRKALLLGISCCAFNLVVVVVQSNDVDVGELDDLSSRSANTAADVEHPHPGPEVRQQVAGGVLGRPPAVRAQDAVVVTLQVCLHACTVPQRPSMRNDVLEG